MKNFYVPCLFVLLLASYSFGSPVTTDQIIGPSSGNLTITNGQATFTLPSYQTAVGGEAILTQNNAATLTNKTFDSSSNVAHQSFGVYDFAIAAGSTTAVIPLNC